VASEEWDDLGLTAQFVVLSMGMALREVARVQFMEEDEMPEDMPKWVKNSPWTMEDMDKVMDVWVKQLDGEEDMDVESDRERGKNSWEKGKGKAGTKRKPLEEKSGPK
jgi:hypothetical protein